ncbi:hypothetical protein TSUD_222990 [Trifolium subterraneum]|uniref:Peroxisomal nicotinamide adenine dinucleotide carrier n=1 Tax=Trifolium subterraneum TaxID=3900 RepID=A0A2Z6P6X7_TRISU|nr:hypothetical protein TSUD_222990 [Trifolium subterraneum]
MASKRHKKASKVVTGRRYVEDVRLRIWSVILLIGSVIIVIFREKINMSDALINGLAGAGGGIIAQLITYPLQTVVKHEGWEQLYGGLTPSLVGIAASEGVYYYFYQIFRNRAEAAALEKKMLGTGDGSVGMFSSLIVAALSGWVNVLLTDPIWLVVTRMQTKESKRTLAVIQEVYDEAGVLGFWKGVLPALVMVINPSIQLMLYETLLAKLKKRRASNSITALEKSLLGAIAKLGAMVVTYPLLVVKARLQARQVNNGDKRHQYKGTWDAIIKMIHYEGFNGFYKGMETKIVQSVLAAAVLFMVKEELEKQTRFLLSKPKLE